MIRKLAILVSVLASSLSSVCAQYDWAPHENNPVITFGFDATSTYTFRPSVLKENGTYHMWYGKQVGTPRFSPRSIAYAASGDGIDWEIRNLFALEPSGALVSFDQIEAVNPSVLVDGDTLRMWYEGFGQLTTGIGYAWSVDGSSWTKVPGPAAGGSVLDPSMDPGNVNRVVYPTVVKMDDSFHMWYSKQAISDGMSRVGYARSSDGVNWTVVPGTGSEQSVLDLGAANTFDESQIWWPWVLYDESARRLQMWYQGIDSPAFGGVPRVGCAQSENGVSWQRVVGAGDAGACWNSLAQPSVVVDAGVYKMWYSLTTNASPQNDEIGYATSDQTSTTTDDEEVPNTLTNPRVYPNPFVETVVIEFEVAPPSGASVQILDMLGRSIYRQDFAPTATRHRLRWDGRRHDGVAAPAGSYILKVVDAVRGSAQYEVVQLIR